MVPRLGINMRCLNTTFQPYCFQTEGADRCGRNTDSLTHIHTRFVDRICKKIKALRLVGGLHFLTLYIWILDGNFWWYLDELSCIPDELQTTIASCFFSIEGNKNDAMKILVTFCTGYCGGNFLPFQVCIRWKKDNEICHETSQWVM